MGIYTYFAMNEVNKENWMLKGKGKNRKSIILNNKLKFIHDKKANKNVINKKDDYFITRFLIQLNIINTNFNNSCFQNRKSKLYINIPIFYKDAEIVEYNNERGLSENYYQIEMVHDVRTRALSLILDRRSNFVDVWASILSINIGIIQISNVVYIKLLADMLTELSKEYLSNSDNGIDVVLKDIYKQNSFNKTKHIYSINWLIENSKSNKVWSSVLALINKYFYVVNSIFKMESSCGLRTINFTKAKKGIVLRKYATVDLDEPLKQLIETYNSSGIMCNGFEGKSIEMCIDGDVYERHPRTGLNSRPLARDSNNNKVSISI